jgi:hypothetical protein
MSSSCTFPDQVSNEPIQWTKDKSAATYLVEKFAKGLGRLVPEVVKNCRNELQSHLPLSMCKTSRVFRESHDTDSCTVADTFHICRISQVPDAVCRIFIKALLDESKLDLEDHV